MITKLIDFAKKVARVLPAFLLWGAFPPVGERTDVFFAVALLLWYSRTHSPRKSFRLWFLNGFLFWVATLSWMPAIIKNGGPWPLVALGHGALSAYLALYFGAFGYLSSKAWRIAKGRPYYWRIVMLVVVEPVLWAGLEIVRSRLFGGFSWNQLGVPLANSGLGAPASVGGVYLLGAVVVLVNGTVASIAERVYKPVRLPVEKWVRSVETFLPFLVVFAVYWAAGAVTRDPVSAETVRFAMVQRNFPCVFKDAEADPLKAYARLFAGVAHAKCDFLVLSESALVEFGDVASPAALRFASFALEKTGAKALLAGGSRRESGKMFNSAALYCRDGAGRAEIAGVYDKVHLVPFGEYIPFDKVFTFLQKLAPVGSCHAGEPKLLESGDVRLGVGICYEDTDSALVRRFARMGADVLVFITNDSWFSESTEALQHSWQAAARAVETGRSVVRVGNSGVTCVIMPDGKKETLSGPEGFPLVDAPGAFAVSVPLSRAAETVYMKYGDKPMLALFFIVIAALFYLERREIRSFPRLVDC